MLKGNVFVTGGAGYLARAIYRRAQRENWDCKFTALGRHEDALTRLHAKFPDVRCIVGDIRNLTRLTERMAGADMVVHAAAMKRVPESETNVIETVDINIHGSENVALAAHANGVKVVVGVSTDKAASPLNLYGCTKMAMERIFGEANHWGNTRFMVTRYGNVVGSTGSIVPVFKEQLRTTGRVKVTEPSMTRFWLSPDDAVDLVTGCTEDQVIEECAGDIIVPSPGAMKIGELAETIVMMALSENYDPAKPFLLSSNRQAPACIDVVGPRPGEKFHESLISEFEAARAQWYPLHDDAAFVIRAPGSFTKQMASDGPGAYSSDEPRFWITRKEMIDMIEDAATI